MVDFAKELNAEQLNVVEHGDGPCLVLAGAGSGKTRTITYRVAYLLEQGIPAENILLVTFTNKAAGEMKERVEKLTNSGKPLPWSGTFHHIAYRILRVYAPLLGYGNPPAGGFTVLDSDDSQSLLKLGIKEVKSGGEGARRFPSAAAVQGIISFATNAERAIAEVIEERYPQWLPFIEQIGIIANDYRLRKKSANAMDFDDLLINLLVLLRQPKVQEKYASQFQYILVDEYQDTNKIQASIIKQLAVVHKNVLVVGDDAQSIYSFRAADIQNILQFSARHGGRSASAGGGYPDAKVFFLTTNYRSSREILDLANGVIANNRDQYQKKLKTLETGARPQLFPQMDQQSEGNFIASKIEELLQAGTPPKEIATLFRAAHHSQMLEVELVRRGIPYDYRGGVRFFERAHIKDILAYLRLMNNLADTAAWLRVLLHEEGIGPAAAQKVTQAIRRLCHPDSPAGEEGSLEQSVRDSSSARLGERTKNDSYDQIRTIGRDVLGPKAQTGWGNFLAIWDKLLAATVRSPATLIAVLTQSPYRDYLDSEFIDSRDRLADIKQLAIFAERYDDLENFLADATLQESFSLIGQEENTEPKEKIILSTIHQAKGLEWGAVFVMNLASGSFPSDRALKEDNGLEEERRLFYVAITRAKRQLFLTYPMAGGSYGDFLSGPSMFLNEINPALIDDCSILMNTTALNDAGAGVEYIAEDRPIKIRPGSFLKDLEDL
ncbi:MAG: ATP-dependent DNA helicase [Candidatus Magasanikbacteria bacterium GW2011_GWA2_50_22]|uniref:DNA 3'-5' helicase n=1 Tax=Candidatus Magasanikbacteria bacterium GW2011_GWA2_50_22 TaxID=1619043 RepID=A0A0G1WFL9_9BACT|nr:MAG: ATP-dependent DNA helicase [Candidatus Magasanikbacteria bacterium GW2011_GWA2_50_22]